MQKWRFWIVPVEDRDTTVAPISRWDLPEDPLHHIIYFTFNESFVREQQTAIDLAEIYDALTGAHLGEMLANSLRERQRDPRRRVHGIKQELKLVLYAAVEAGTLKFERYEVPWPFPEVEEKRELGKEKNEELLPVEFQVLRWEDHTPLAGARAVIRYPDGREVDHTTDTNGRVIVFGRTDQTFELVRVFDAEEEHHLALGTHSSSSGTA